MSYESTTIIAPSAEYASFLDMKRRAFTIKVLCVIDFIFAIYGIAFQIWWLGGGLLFAPVGFWGAHRYDKRFVLVYIIYLLLDMILQIIFAFVDITPLLIVLTILILGIQLFIVYYVYQFYKKLPREGIRAFSEFERPTEFPLKSMSTRR